jgi:hypothetical protein
MTPSDEIIAKTLMLLAHERGVDKTFCPSEAARRVDPERRRDLMPEVRRVAGSMPWAATQKGQTVDPQTARGPIRLALKLTTDG